MHVQPSKTNLTLSVSLDKTKIDTVHKYLPKYTESSTDYYSYKCLTALIN